MKMCGSKPRKSSSAECIVWGVQLCDWHISFRSLESSIATKPDKLASFSSLSWCSGCPGGVFCRVMYQVAGGLVRDIGVNWGLILLGLNKYTNRSIERQTIDGWRLDRDINIYR